MLHLHFFGLWEEAREKPTQTRGEHSRSKEKGLGQAGIQTRNQVPAASLCEVYDEGHLDYIT